MDVIADITPVRLRIREICSKEYVKLMSKSDNSLKEMLSKAHRVGNNFTPLSWIKIVSKEVEKRVI